MEERDYTKLPHRDYIVANWKRVRTMAADLLGTTEYYENPEDSLQRVCPSELPHCVGHSARAFNSIDTGMKEAWEIELEKNDAPGCDLQEQPPVRMSWAELNEAQMKEAQDMADSLINTENWDMDEEELQLEAPDNNPKARVGALKAPLHLVPPSAEYYIALALKDGAEKYGPYNWRSEAISISTYVGAIRRHLNAWWDGEDDAQDSGVHHIAHVMASCALILDAASVGQLIDDRPPAGGVVELMDAYMEEQKGG